MKKILNYIHNNIKEIFTQYRYLKERSYVSGLKNKIRLQLIVAASFYILSVANIVVQSYTMLALTLAGGIINTLCAVMARKTEKSEICTYSSIITCALLFGFFVVYGGK